MTLDDFQRAKLDEWTDWLSINPADGIYPICVGMVDRWARSGAGPEAFPTREQFAERQDAVTSEAI